jgi:hypothetical protein
VITPPPPSATAVQIYAVLHERQHLRGVKKEEDPNLSFMLEAWTFRHDLSLDRRVSLNRRRWVLDSAHVNATLDVVERISQSLVSRANGYACIASRIKWPHRGRLVSGQVPTIDSAPPTKIVGPVIGLKAPELRRRVLDGPGDVLGRRRRTIRSAFVRIFKLLQGREIEAPGTQKIEEFRQVDKAPHWNFQVVWLKAARMSVVGHNAES